MMMIMPMEDMNILYLQEQWRTLVICIGKYLMRLYVDDCVVPASNKTGNEIHRVQQTGTCSLQKTARERSTPHITVTVSMPMTMPVYYNNKKEVKMVQRKGI
jgi:hypothetical protein